MPAFVGPVTLDLMGSSSIFSVGDAYSLSPKSADKTSVGSGAVNSGDFIEAQNLFNITNFYDGDLFDQTNILNK